MKRFAALAALMTLACPWGARADSTTYTAPYQMQNKGGDMWNQISADPTTGEMTVLRVNPAGLSTGLGCGGQGGWANFSISHVASNVTTVTATYTNAVVDSYSWVDVAVRQGDHYVASTVQRGITAGDGSVTVNLGEVVNGPVSVWFGLQVVSGCPNINGARATFTSVTLS